MSISYNPTDIRRIPHGSRRLFPGKQRIPLTTPGGGYPTPQSVLQTIVLKQVNAAADRFAEANKPTLLSRENQRPPLRLAFHARHLLLLLSRPQALQSRLFRRDA